MKKNRVSEGDDFNFQSIFDGMLSRQRGINSIQRSRMEETLAALLADFGLDILHEAQPAIQPVLFGHALARRIAAT